MAFEDDPEEEIRKLNSRRGELERALSAHESDNQQNRVQYEQAKEGVSALNRLLPAADDTLADRVDEIRERLDEAQEAARFIQQHGNQLAKLEPIVSVLQSDPEQFEQLKKITPMRSKPSAMRVSRLLPRRKLCSAGPTSATPIRRKCSAATAISTRSCASVWSRRSPNAAARAMRAHAAQLSQYNQVLASLKSSYDTKKELLNDLYKELQDIGVRADAGAEERARARRDELHMQLSNNRSRRNQLEKALTFCEAEMDNLTRKLRKLERDYCEMREQVVTAKAGWCAVMRLVKDNGVERRLHRRELAYLSPMSCVQCRIRRWGRCVWRSPITNICVTCCVSRKIQASERKIQFFVAVYQHLRERIRQDIIRTDDPVEAIEQMEIELSRLTEELTNREQKLAISSRSVANIIRKTIQREQNRIRMLNRVCRASPSAVNSVRLNVNVRETHSMLLDVLSEQHEQHRDLFNSNRLTFSEALAKLYQRLNPQIDMGQRTPQTIGEELLDYRNYLEMEVEVNRGSDGWLRAESGALSTGKLSVPGCRFW